MWIFAGCALTFVALAVVFGALLRRVLSEASTGNSAAEWELYFHKSSYEPLARLPDPRDYEFAASRHGLEQRRKSLRNERRAIFRRYLHSLNREYGRVSSFVRLERGELEAELLRHKTSLVARMMAAEIRLTLHAAGFETLDVQRLVEPLQSMGTDLGKLSQEAGLNTV